ncbi:hypothetical protein V6N11_082999 [Hibiscus sabdariffa]|uniref:RNase H type-1 domain-containing protein n=1 Tax=Hibiscus sabdariffa TaxID=183260 RepID=A0ABR2QKL3_9ROSI
MKYYKVAGICTVLHEDWRQFFQAWNGLEVSNNKAWFQLLPFALIWSVWLFRNNVVFNGHQMDWMQLVFLIKVRLAKWIKAKFGRVSCSSENLIADISVVDNFVPFCGRPASTPRYDSGKTLLSFSNSVGVNAPALVELEAICVGVRMFCASIWSNNFRLIVESDCKIVVDWILGMTESPVIALETVREVTDASRVRNLLIRLIPRCINVEADLLAEEGIR